MIRIFRCKALNDPIQLESADTFLKRFCGLMLRRELPMGCGLLLNPCSSVHTCFMRFPIDVLYLDKAGYVLGKETLKPWRIGKYIRGTKSVVEFNVGVAAIIEVGEQVLQPEHTQK